MKFCQFVASVYPHMLTSFGQFVLIFNKMALIFLGVHIVFTVSSFEFQQARLPWDERPQFTQRQSTELSGLGATLES